MALYDIKRKLIKLTAAKLSRILYGKTRMTVAVRAMAPIILVPVIIIQIVKQACPCGSFEIERTLLAQTVAHIRDACNVAQSVNKIVLRESGKALHLFAFK